jgi:hypothetical protein
VFLRYNCKLHSARNAIREAHIGSNADALSLQVQLLYKKVCSKILLLRIRALELRSIDIQIVRK